MTKPIFNPTFNSTAADSKYVDFTMKNIFGFFSTIRVTSLDVGHYNEELVLTTAKIEEKDEIIAMFKEGKYKEIEDTLNYYSTHSVVRFNVFN
ncbi:hypothetical protein JHD46_05515 [Sulfurimonas sp. SAG-AH-194-C20]|nr:hypothetical protein [Sulfurimonas sp. SAG-AH-194-C20]MDF1879098.1 hypothetical protein [Sulfurimonas sp. SAG-AH-194-C20]